MSKAVSHKKLLLYAILSGVYIPEIYRVDISEFGFAVCTIM